MFVIYQDYLSLLVIHILCTTSPILTVKQYFELLPPIAQTIALQWILQDPSQNLCLLLDTYNLPCY